MNFDIKPIFPACNDFDDLHDGMDIVIDLGGSMFPAKVIAKPGYDFFEWEGETHRGYLALGELIVNVGCCRKEDIVARPEKLRRLREFLCYDCGSDSGFFMLKDDLWNQAWPNEMEETVSISLADGGFPEVGGQLCQVCVEKRLGRKLLTNDFSILPEE